MDRSPLHVLIVDDSPEDRLTLRRILSRFAPGAYTISEAAMGAQALASCRAAPPDCVLLDQHLPDLDGLEVLTNLHTFADVPVILLTGLSSEHLAVEAFQRGAQDYLIKGALTPERLYLTVQRAVSTSQIVRERNQTLALLTTMLDTIPIGMAVLDAQLRILQLNPALASLMGQQGVVLRGEPLLTCWPDLAPALADPCRQVLQGTSFADLELRLPSPDALPARWISLSGTPVLGANGIGPLGLITAQDISARKQAELAIQHAAERLQMLHTIDRSVLSAETPERIATIAASRLQQLVPCDYVLVAAYDHEQQSIQNLSVIDLIGDLLDKESSFPIDQQDLLPPFALGERWYVPDNTDLSSLSPQALFPHIRSFRSIMHFPLLAEGQLLGILRIAATGMNAFTQADITIAGELADLLAIVLRGARLRAQLEEERAQLAQRVAERTADLSTANADLARAARAKDEFLANMSHELRTPLNAILAFSESLLDGIYGSLSPRQIDAITAIETGGRHLLTLISDILDLAKVESGQLDLQLEFVPIADICQASLMFVREQAIKKNLRLSIRQYDHLAAIQADPKRLKQMLVNLLSNAVKFTPEQGEVTLDAVIDAEAGQVRFMVQDTGIGIAAENISRLFKPFTQLDSALSRQHEGTGLGLALVRRLAELHEGAVSVESTPGVGSCFTICLPYTSPPPASTAAPAQTAQEQASPTQRASGTFRGRILLTEDHPANIFALGEYLHASNYNVVVAQNGYDALAQAAATNPQLILMDIQMPGMDGLETIRRLRALPAHAQTPIIALTALAMPGDRERCLAAGATTYMIKPISLKQLAQLIQQFLDPSQLRDGSHG